MPDGALPRQLISELALKEQLLWLEHFATVEELVAALHAFRDRYNREWLIQRHGHRSPAAVRLALNEALAA